MSFFGMETDEKDDFIVQEEEKPRRIMETCPVCGGKGTVRDYVQVAPGHCAHRSVPCKNCKGSGITV